MILGKHNVDFFQPIPITDNYLLIMADTDKIISHLKVLTVKHCIGVYRCCACYVICSTVIRHLGKNSSKFVRCY